MIITFSALLLLAFSSAAAERRCPGGSFLSASNTCEYCPAGTYSTKPSSNNCTKCPPGTTSWYWNSTSVKDCRLCPLGFYIQKVIPLEMNDCHECFPSEFGDKPGSCKQCPRGTSNAEFGQTRCTVCPPGTRSLTGYDAMVKGGCERCPAGTYNRRWRSDTCASCPRGSKPNRARTACIANCPGRKPINRCPNTCKPGSARWKKDGPCRPCPPNKVGFANAVTGCAQCPATYLANRERTACVCPPGKGSYNESCVRCPAATTLRNGVCQCLPPSIKTGGRCECPAFKMVRGRFCVPCSRFQLLRKIRGNFRSDCVLCPHKKSFDAKTGTCVKCPPGTKLARGQRGPCRKVHKAAR